MKGRMWCVIKDMYEASRSAILLAGEKSSTFRVEQGVAQGCSLSQILCSVFLKDLLKAVEETGQAHSQPVRKGVTYVDIVNCVQCKISVFRGFVRLFLALVLDKTGF